MSYMKNLQIRFEELKGKESLTDKELQELKEIQKLVV